MKEHSNLTQHEFDGLLNWLGPDRESAGDMYLRLSEGLKRYFGMRGCHDSQALVDETINRVAKSLAYVNVPSVNKPITYFYGVARNVFFEYLQEKRRRGAGLVGDDDSAAGVAYHGQGSDERFDCLDDCVDGLGPDGSSVVMAYFEKDGGEKILARRELAENLQISIGSLHVRIHRLKASLRKCIEKCLRDKESL